MSRNSEEKDYLKDSMGRERRHLLLNSHTGNLSNLGLSKGKESNSLQPRDSYPTEVS